MMAMHSRDFSDQFQDTKTDLKNYASTLITLAVCGIVYYAFDIENAKDMWEVGVPLVKDVLIVWFLKCFVDHMYLSSKTTI